MNTNQVTNLDQLDNALSYLDKIQGMSAVGLVFFSCIVFGYVLRYIKPFPNNGIPVAVVMWGGLFMMLLASGRPTSMPAHVWVIRNLLIGLVIGGFAWAAHFFVIRKVETWFGTKFPSSQDTTFFKKEPVQPAAPPAQPEPPKG